jgi:hypothetical protein
MLFVAAALYLASLFLPALHTEMQPQYGGLTDVKASFWNGWQVLMFGAAGILDGTPAWYSNPLLLVSAVLYAKRRRSCFFVSCAALSLAFSSVLYKEMWNDRDPPEQIVGYGPGFYLWMLSFLIFTFVARLDLN